MDSHRAWSHSASRHSPAEMTSVSVGTKPRFRIRGEIPEGAEPVGPGLYVYNATFEGLSVLADPTEAKRRLMRVVEDLYAKVREQAPDLQWQLHYAELTYDPETRNGITNIVYELQPGIRASLSAIFWLIVSLIAAAILAWLAYRVIRTTIYVGERIASGVEGAGDVLAEALPIFIPALLVILLVYAFS